jgi:hypothetical protein
MSGQIWPIHLVKQGKFNVVVVLADGLVRLLLKNEWGTFLYLLNGGSLAMSAGANPMDFRPVWSSFSF